MQQNPSYLNQPNKIRLTCMARDVFLSLSLCFSQSQLWNELCAMYGYYWIQITQNNNSKWTRRLKCILFALFHGFRHHVDSVSIRYRVDEICDLRQAWPLIKGIYTLDTVIPFKSPYETMTSDRRKIVDWLLALAPNVMHLRIFQYWMKMSTDRYAMLSSR